MNTKYRIGDRVIVCEDLASNKVYKMDGNSSGLFAIREMLNLRGETVTISSIGLHYNPSGLCYEIEEPPKNVRWTDEMFSGLAVPADEIYVDEYI